VKHRTTFLIAVLLGSCAALNAAEFKVNGRTFVVPDGFTIELVANRPLVDRPIVCDFDEQGRLYVADSSGSNEKVQKQLENPTHRIVRLEDSDGDGRYDKQTVFADKMMFPEGTMWLDGSLYVSAPPSIWKLTDKNGDGVADERVEWFKGKTLTGCANDLHGPYAGPDGWIYWCKGAFAKQTYERPGKTPFSTRASHIFRARPDGSGIEPVMTGGMDNPVDVVFTPEGERIFTTTFLQNPGGGRRDGLIHAIYGGIYGKIHDVIDEHPWTGPEVMPVLSHLGPAAPAGLTRYDSDAFGVDYQNNIFACQFNLRKVSRHIVSRQGSGLASVDLDFLSSPDLDFHPTDVQVDADGSLLVVDTGGWYKLCCPTSQIEKADILGAIYRIRKTGAAKVQDPRGLAIDWQGLSNPKLYSLLNDGRPAVRRRAIAALAKLGTEAVLTASKTAQERPEAASVSNLVWVLARIDDAKARAAIRDTLQSSNPLARAVALHSISLWHDAEAKSALVGILKSGLPVERRLAAEALGRIGDKSVIPALLDAASTQNDRSLEHAITYALIEIGDPSATSAGLKHNQLAARRTALIALDQMVGGTVDPTMVAADLGSSDPITKETAAWIVGRHREWGDVLANVLGARLRDEKLSAQDRREVEGQLARFAKSKAIELLIAKELANYQSLTIARSALSAVAASGVKDVPPAWTSGLVALLSSDNPSVVAQAVATARTLPVKGEPAGVLTARLLEVAGRSGLPVAVRIEALAAVPGGLKAVSAKHFTLLRDELQPDKAVATRLIAAQVVSTSKLTTEQLSAMTDLVASVGPLEVDKLLAAYEQSSTESVGLKLIAALKGSAARSALRVDMIKPRIAKFGPKVQAEAESLYSSLNVNAADQRAKLDALLTTLPVGEIRRGQAVFNGTKAACITCHALGYVGGNIGPDLSRIGQIRVDRDLLEAIVYPSASFVRSFEPMLVATKDGKSINGLLRKDASDEIVLTVAPNQDVTIRRDDIEEMRPGSVSIMPAGLDQQLTKQELADLIAFLKSRK
jgi:putative membrane-bound dehydrogenase-like protein